MTRYEIDDGAAWDDAEKQVKQAAKSGKAHPLVSVKTKSKRKAEEADGHDERTAEKGHSKSKKAKREKKR
jgi:N-acetyltransferase 10